MSRPDPRRPPADEGDPSKSPPAGDGARTTPSPRGSKPASGQRQSGGKPAQGSPVNPAAARPNVVKAPGHPASAGGGPRATTQAAVVRPIQATPVQKPVSNRPIPLKLRKPGDLPDAYEEAKDEEAEALEKASKNAPALLVSVVLHILVVIILGIQATTKKQESVSMIEATSEDPADTEGEQLIDPTVVEGKAQVDNPENRTILEPKGLGTTPGPVSTSPQMPTLGLHGSGAMVGPTGSSIGLGLKGRGGGFKNVLLGAYGGGKGTQDAVELGLQWLIKQQRSDGSWSLAGPYSGPGNEENAIAATAMALLAFQGNGDTHIKGKYSRQISRGWNYLLKLQKADGDFYRQGPPHHRLYTQAQCTIALCELYGMSTDTQVRLRAEKAIEYAVKIQDKEGGWRYEPGNGSDTSVTGWFVMALQSARMAGLAVPKETLDNITKFLDKYQLNGGRGYSYVGGYSAGQAVTAEGLLCRQYLGWPQNDPRLVEGIGALTKSPINFDDRPRDTYYWYYATQACHHMEGKIWSDWNASLRVQLPAHQEKAGSEAGSWSPEGDKWGTIGGRLYVTCLSIYMLEVYYRHVPLYSGYKFMTSN